MGLISSSIPNFVNGVSQQPFNLRLVSQGEVQENGLSTVSQGLKKRPGTKHIAQILGTKLSDAFIHIINRDSTERYVVVITNGDLKVFDLDGNAKTVNFPNGKTYLGTTGEVSTTFRAVTVADYTFILNRSKVVMEDTSTSNPAGSYRALVNVKQGNYGKTYKVFINGTQKASLTTNNGGTATDVTTISTDYIASQLSTQLTTNGVTNTLVGSVILISSASDFTIRTEDGFNNTAMVAIKEQLQKFTDLPNNGVSDGFTVEIVGDANSAFDNYYLKWDSQANNKTGVWRETCKPGLSVGIQDSTMPYGLIREADGTFTFKALTWDNRTIGDANSNPNPTFVGRTINDLFFYRNRLGFLSDENVVFSEAGNYFNLYRTTVTQLLDSEMIDAGVSHTKVSILEHAVPFNKQLLLFSAQTQFVLDQDDILSPKNLLIKQSTEFPCNVVAKPVGIGKNIYFVTDKGSWSAVREYFADFNNVSNDATEVTGHIPKYIPSGVFKLSAAPNEDTLLALTANERNAIYVYRYFWANNEKMQSSWSKWVFPAGNEILNAEFIESSLYLVVNRDSGVYLERLNISLGNQAANEPYQVLLDRRVTVPKASLTYSGGVTRFPYSLDVAAGETLLAVTAVGGTDKAGVILQVMKDATGFYVQGRWTGSDLVVGRKYAFKYTLSPITVKTAQPGGGQKSDTEGRLQIRKVSFNYADTGYFDVHVTPHNRNTYTYRFSGKVLGNETATIGAPSFDTGRFSVPIMSRNLDTEITILNDSPVPCSILSAEWEGFFVKRSQPV